MPAEVETMMYVREKPWHGLGVRVEEAPNSREALEVAGLNWNVKQSDVCLPTGVVIPGMKANVRDSDEKVLGVVSNKYKIVQNKDAFDFTDSLVNTGDVKYETAGSLKGGKTIFLLAQMPKVKILGDDIEQYLCFTNNHDGTGAIRACMTDVRVVCNNTLNLALNNAQRTWSCRHMGNIESKLDEARRCLGLAEEYTAALAKFADKAAVITVDEAKTMEMLNELFPINTEDSDCVRRNAKANQDGFISCIMAPDLANFRGTAWGLINAASDFAYHRIPQRNTKTYQESLMNKAISGSEIINAITDMCVTR